MRNRDRSVNTATHTTETKEHATVSLRVTNTTAKKVHRDATLV